MVSADTSMARHTRRHLRVMAGAANFAWANRFSMAYQAYQALAKEFAATPDALDMRVVSDVSHNIAKVETRLVEGKPKKLLVHCSDAHVPAAPPTYPRGLPEHLSAGTHRRHHGHE